jgi:hypothetical protein
MKTCFVVNYWADTEEKVDMVVECIRQLKKTGKDVIYTSLYPIDRRISNETEFSIYARENEMITLFDLIDNDVELHNNTSYETHNFKFFSRSLNWKDVGYAVTKQFATNFRVLHSVGYTHIHFINGDCIISDSELAVFDFIETACKMMNKKAYFEDITKKFTHAYSGIYFYSEVSFFLKNFPFYETKKQYISSYSNVKNFVCFEEILKIHFGESCLDHLLLGNNDSYEFGHLMMFKDSKIDIVSSYNANSSYHIIPYYRQDNSVERNYIFVVSNEATECKFSIYVDQDVEESILEYNGYLAFKTEKKEFNLKITKGEEIVFDQYITKETLRKIQSYSFFDAYKKNIS